MLIITTLWYLVISRVTILITHTRGQHNPAKKLPLRLQSVLCVERETERARERENACKSKNELRCTKPSCSTPGFRVSGPKPRKQCTKPGSLMLVHRCFLEVAVSGIPERVVCLVLANSFCRTPAKHKQSIRLWSASRALQVRAVPSSPDQGRLYTLEQARSPLRGEGPQEACNAQTSPCVLTFGIHALVLLLSNSPISCLLPHGGFRR